MCREKRRDIADLMLKSSFLPSAIQNLFKLPEVVCVTVVLTTYNCVDRVDSVVRGLAAQTLSQKEIVVVDDFSTDGTREVLKLLSKELDVRLILNDRNRGAGFARNGGLVAARGEYIIFLDDDDAFDPMLLEVAYKRAVEADADFIVLGSQGRSADSDENSTIEWSIRKDLLPEAEVFAPADVVRDVFHTFVWWPWDKLIRRQVIVDEGLRYQEIRSSNDLLFVCAAFLASKRVCIEPRVLITHILDRPGSISSSRERSFDCSLMALQALRQFLVKFGLFEVRAEDFQYYSVHFLYWHQSTLRPTAQRELCKLIVPFFGDLSLIMGDLPDEYTRDRCFQIYRGAGLRIVSHELERARVAMAGPCSQQSSSEVLRLYIMNMEVIVKRLEEESLLQARII